MRLNALAAAKAAKAPTPAGKTLKHELKEVREFQQRVNLVMRLNM